MNDNIENTSMAIIRFALVGEFEKIRDLISIHSEMVPQTLAVSAAWGNLDLIIFLLNNYADYPGCNASVAFKYSYVSEKFENAEFILSNYEIDSIDIIDWVIDNKLEYLNSDLVNTLRLHIKAEEERKFFSEIPEGFPPKSVSKC